MNTERLLGTGDGPRHLAVCGDNLDVVLGLDGQADLVYLDPPYNTGGENIGTYTDAYDDWDAFLAPRLARARDLLKPTGVCFVAIGDDEHHRLRVLMDDVFGAANFVANIVWDGSTRGDSRWVSGGAEYMVVYARDKTALETRGRKWREPRPGAADILAAARRAWDESDHDPATAKRLLSRWRRSLAADHPAKAVGLSDYTKFDEHGDVYRYGPLAKPVPGPHFYDVLHPDTGVAVQVPANGWRMPETTMKTMIENGDIVFGEGVARAKLRLKDLSRQVPRNVFASPRGRGADHVRDLLGDKRFPFPKDHEVLMRWFRMAAPDDGLIVDLFAGSGSTGEAVVRLNADDGGTRRVVLVTNNENDVFDRVLVPRLEAVVSGLRPDGSRHGDPIGAVFEVKRA